MQKELNYHPVRDILEELKQIQLQAAECCDQAAYTSDDQPALLAGMFRYQQEVLDNHLSLPSGNELDQAKSIKVPFVPMRQADEALQSLKAASKEKPNVIADRSFCLQDEMIKLLRKLACCLYGTPASTILLEVADDFKSNQEKTFEPAATEITGGG